MNKRVLIILVGMSVSLVKADPLLSLSPESNGGINPFMEFCFDFQFTTSPIDELRNVPEFIRNVPPHHDDVWKSHPGPILKDSADAPWLTEIRFLKLGLETDFGKSVTWKNYLDLSFNYGYYFKWGADIHRRNYITVPGTEERGYGAALTFWCPGYETLISGLKSELQFPSEEGYALLGVGYRQYDFGVITGYDRYDRLENRHLFKMGKINELSLYAGGRTEGNSKRSFFEGRIGLNFNSYDKDSEYRSVDVDMEDVSFFLSASFGWRF